MNDDKKPKLENLKGLKILFSAEDFWPRLGGGEAFIDQFLTSISKDNEIHCIYIGEKKKDSRLFLHPIKKSYAFKNIPFFNRTIIRQYIANKRWKKVLREKIKEIKPDLIITQLIYTPSTAEVAKEFNLPVVLFIHNYEHFSPNLFKNIDSEKVEKGDLSYLPLSYKVQQPFCSLLLKWHEKALKKCDLILPDTDYIVRLAKRFYDVESHAFFPVVDLSEYIISDKYSNEKKEYITFINPEKHKGRDIVMKIIEKMPDHKFLIVCGVKQEKENLKQFPNMVYMKDCPDIKKAYAKSRILLVPSLWPEPLGRVVLEAGINNIPSIVSPLGGLPEAVGKGGYVVNNLYDADEWVDKIKKLDNDLVYQNLSSKAKEHAENYTFEKQITRFKKFLSSIKQ